MFNNCCKKIKGNKMVELFGIGCVLLFCLSFLVLMLRF